MRFKVDSLQLKVKPGNRAEPNKMAGRRRGGGSRHGGQATEEAPRARRCQGRFRGIGRPTVRKTANRGAPLRVELSASVHWLSWSLRSECSPTTNSKRKPGAPGRMRFKVESLQLKVGEARKGQKSKARPFTLRRIGHPEIQRQRQRAKGAPPARPKGLVRLVLAFVRNETTPNIEAGEPKQRIHCEIAPNDSGSP